MYGTFSYCSSLKIIPSGLFNKLSKVTTFERRSNLTTVPWNLFNNNLQARDFRYTFSQCINITSSVPALWNRKDKGMGSCYAGCTKAGNLKDMPYEWRS